MSLSGPGKAVQRQTLCAQATEASGVSTNDMGFSSSALIKGSGNLNEVSHKPALISEKPSAAMQRLIGVVGLKLTMSFLLFCVSLTHKSCLLMQSKF